MPLNGYFNLFFDVVEDKNFEEDKYFPIGIRNTCYVHDDDHDDYKVNNEVVIKVGARDDVMVSSLLQLFYFLDSPSHKDEVGQHHNQQQIVADLIVIIIEWFIRTYVRSKDQREESQKKWIVNDWNDQQIPNQLIIRWKRNDLKVLF